MKRDFIAFVEELMKAAPEVTMSENARTFYEAFKQTKDDKPEITDNGKLILKYMQNSDKTNLKSKEIADGLFCSSRMVSGSIRKLVNDGFCDKIDTDPVIYTLTDKGRNYIIKEGDND